MNRRHLNRDEQLRAVGMVEAGQTYRGVAEALITSASVICRLMERYRETGDVRERHTGRTRATNPIQDRFIRLNALRDRSVTAGQIVNQLNQTHNIVVSDQTVRNRLHEFNLHSRRPLRVPPLTRGNRALRLEWAHEHLQWGHQEWSTILFTDESRFGLHPDSRRLRVWRQPGNLERLRAYQEVYSYQGGTVMVWGGIQMGRRTDLVLLDGFVNAASYRDSILQPVVLPYAAEIGPNFQLMHDNARPHTARLVREFLETENINVLPWPAQSPDLNPIEHIWDSMGRRLFNQQRQFQTREQLFNCLIDLWNTTEQEEIDNLISSMPNRCQAVVNARGGHTTY